MVLMADPDLVEELRSDKATYKRWAEEAANVREELRVARDLNLKKQVRLLRRKLKLKLERVKVWKGRVRFQRKAIADEKADRFIADCFTNDGEDMKRMIGFYPRWFNDDIAGEMNLKGWLDLSDGLSREHAGASDGDQGRWEKPLHRELLGRSEARGFTLADWECTLLGATKGTPVPVAAYPSDPFIKQALRRHHHLLNCERIDELLSPAQKEVYAKLLKEFTARRRRVWPALSDAFK